MPAATVQRALPYRGPPTNLHNWQLQLASYADPLGDSSRVPLLAKIADARGGGVC